MDLAHLRSNAQQFAAVKVDLLWLTSPRRFAPITIAWNA
jgi:hypothetical protein